MIAILRCGMSEVMITPPLGYIIPGQFEAKISTGVKDDIYVKSLVLSDSNIMLAFVTIDALVVENEVVKEIRKRASAITGIPGKNIMVSATHTHTGPPVISIYGSRKNHAYIRWLIEKATDAVVVAYQRMEPARIGCGVGHEADIAFNRRFYMKNGKTRTNPGVGNSEIVKAAAPIDSDVTVMRIDRINGEPLGVVTNYSCHPDVAGGTEFSADYPGELSNVLKKALGENLISLFLTGACGDINHVDVTGKMKINNPEHYKKMGGILAGEVIKVREKIEVSKDVIVRCVSKVVSIKRRLPSPEMNDAAISLIEKGNSDEVETCFAKEILELSVMQKTTESVEFQVIRVGEMALIAMSGEMFVEIGLKIKKNSKFRYNIICELANGNVGYVATKKAHSEGGYEIGLSKYTYLVSEAESVFIESVVELLDSVK